MIMLRKIIVAIYAITMTIISTLFTPVKTYVLTNNSFIHADNRFRSIFIPWKEAADKSMIRYDLDFPRLILFWVVITVLFASLYYIFGKNNLTDSPGD